MRHVVAFALLLLAAGCVPEPAFDNDPLVGGRPLPRNGAPPASPYNPVASTPTTPAGPLQLPPPTGPVSPAALATGSSPAADASALRLGPPPNPAPAAGALTSGPSVGGDAWHGAASNAGAVLKGPEPISDGLVKPIAVIAPPMPGGPPLPAVSGPPSAPAAVDAYGQVQDMLAQRQVAFQSLEGPDDHGAWRFSCGVPSRDQAGAVHRIEVTVPGDRGLAAMRAAIDQIDQYQRQAH